MRIVVIVESEKALVDRLRGKTADLLSCGSIWRHGPSWKLPITEDDGTPPVGEHSIAKAATTRMLKDETAAGGLVTTSLAVIAHRQRTTRRRPTAEGLGMVW